VVVSWVRCVQLTAAIVIFTSSFMISAPLADLGHEVYVANPRRLRAIYLDESKSDRVDAEYLARIGRLDPTLLFPGWFPRRRSDSYMIHVCESWS